MSSKLSPIRSYARTTFESSNPFITNSCTVCGYSSCEAAGAAAVVDAAAVATGVAVVVVDAMDDDIDADAVAVDAETIVGVSFFDDDDDNCNGGDGADREAGRFEDRLIVDADPVAAEEDDKDFVVALCFC
mmetsp:Transcript_11061/g.13326  ORF Transcript_11061/g.13326 Transcript_11061/m.13326 type:complete len:131 (+) Transcript_11061:179-571(+)